jgi:hypothetical protein
MSTGPAKCATRSSTGAVIWPALVPTSSGRSGSKTTAPPRSATRHRARTRSTPPTPAATPPPWDHPKLAFEGTDLYYGDVFGGDEACIVSFEVDGVDYTFRRGLPYPTGEDGAPDSLQILAMAPAVMGEIDQWDGQVPLGAPEGEVLDLVAALYDGDPPEYRRGARYGAAMIGAFTRGAGTVFNAGTCEWVSGLIHRDPFTERITRNVLHRFLKEAR